MRGEAASEPGCGSTRSRRISSRRQNVRRRMSAFARALELVNEIHSRLKCEWMKNDIDVLDGAAVIRAPFSSDCVEGEPRTVAQVRKIVSVNLGGRGPTL